MESVSRLRSAVEAYRTPFLDGFTLDDSPEFEAWVLNRRQRYERQALEGLSLLADWHEEGEEFEQAEVYNRRQLEIEPWREEVHQQLMHLLAKQGKRSQALAQFEKLCKVLGNELGAKPTSYTVGLYEQIREGRLGIEKGITSDAAALIKESLRNNLPFQLTSFIPEG